MKFRNLVLFIMVGILLMSGFNVATSAPLNDSSKIPDFKIKLDASLAAQQQKEGVAPEKSDANKPVKPASKDAKQIKKTIKVPSVIGKLKIVAKKTLTKMGFKVKLVGKKIGKIRKQKPVAGTRLVPGATVTLTVGK